MRNELMDDQGGGSLDLRSLTKDINASVQMIIQRHLSPLRKGGYLNDDMMDDDEEGNDGVAPKSTVHGHIRSTQDRSRDKDSIGFDSSPGMDSLVSPKPGNTASGGNKGANNPSSVPSNVTSPAPSVADEEVVPVKRSKADRLLGISTDAKTGLPFNNDPTGPSHKAGLFGSIGSLFSSKPNSGGNQMGSMASERYSSMNSTNQRAGGHPKHGLDTIVDEGNEDEHTGNYKPIAGSENRSDRNNRGKGVKSRRDSNSSNNLTESTSGKSDTSVGGTATAVINPQVLVELTAEEANYRNLMANLLNLADVKVSEIALNTCCG